MYTTLGAYASEMPATGPYTGYAYVALVDPTVPASALCVSPNTGLYFFDVPAGTTRDQTVTLTSCGTQPLAITGASAAAGVFTVPASKNGCTQSVAVGQSCTLTVRYSPTALETDVSSLTIQSNAGAPAILPLYGQGAIPVISVNNTPSFDYDHRRPDQCTAATQHSESRWGSPRSQSCQNDDLGRFFLRECSLLFLLRTRGLLHSHRSRRSHRHTQYLASNDPVHPIFSVQLLRGRL